MHTTIVYTQRYTKVFVCSYITLEVHVPTSDFFDIIIKHTKLH